MSAEGWFAISFLIMSAGLVLLAFACVSQKEPDIMRRQGNQDRLDLARRVGYGYYTHEESDGSLSWRRVPAD